MDWDDGRLLLAVSRAGTLLDAARTVGLNQATLSRRLTALEKTMGISLLVRRTTGCTLTEAGRMLADAMERVENEFLQTQAALTEGGESPSGTIRIGAPDGFGHAFIAPRLDRFASAYPNLQIQLVPVSQTFSLSKREADIAVTLGRPQSGRLIAQKLTDYTLSLYASPDYLARFGTPKDRNDLLDHRLVGFVDDLVFSPMLAYAQEFHPGWRSTVEVSSTMGQFEAVCAGAGIAVLHDFMAAGRSDLIRILPDLITRRDYWLIHHESLRGLARIRAASDFLLGEVKSAAAQFVRQTGGEAL
ncbi:LysR family transcriptional regulator [Notoacmeibacter sp. MSK16QG-6]|uniref:LysR family transcriptional regulator n=1 Tax=Notoacmeibacter sp. MSK16QG-6 TaxID=2957982 RepID=UPI00209D7C94|nr:LysR family transcriptional regulator [Notoacmeibacter sp. MSK16QG-6]MCP1200225.1 LysR family transcriptional regulator [Notoacmeibacter sp. MSK16QG-6]